MKRSSNSAFSYLEFLVALVILLVFGLYLSAGFQHNVELSKKTDLDFQKLFYLERLASRLKSYKGLRQYGLTTGEQKAWASHSSIADLSRAIGYGKREGKFRRLKSIEIFQRPGGSLDEEGDRPIGKIYIARKIVMGYPFLAIYRLGFEKERYQIETAVSAYSLESQRDFDRSKRK